MCDHDKIRHGIGVTDHQAWILLRLYEHPADQIMDAYQLDVSVPVRQHGGRRSDDPEFRSHKTLHVQVYYIRLKHGKEIIESRRGRGGGYRLSRVGRERIAAKLQEREG